MGKKLFIFFIIISNLSLYSQGGPLDSPNVEALKKGFFESCLAFVKPFMGWIFNFILVLLLIILLVVMIMLYRKKRKKK